MKSKTCQNSSTISRKWQFNCSFHGFSCIGYIIFWNNNWSIHFILRTLFYVITQRKWYGNTIMLRFFCLSGTRMQSSSYVFLVLNDKTHKVPSRHFVLKIILWCSVLSFLFLFQIVSSVSFTSFASSTFVKHFGRPITTIHFIRC